MTSRNEIFHREFNDSIFLPLTNLITKDRTSFSFCFLFHAELYKGLPLYLCLMSPPISFTVVTDRLNN